MASAFTFMLAVIAGLFLTAKTDCGGNLSNTKNYYEYIRSPNFPSEKGHTANCSWKFKPPDDGKDYVLHFIFRDHMLSYTTDSGEQKCAAQLTMNGKLVKCTAYIYHPRTTTNCSLYYKSSTCESTVRHLTENPATSVCSSFLINSFPVELTYVSDGVNRLITGFRALYEFMECKQDSTKTTFSTTVATSTENKQFDTPGMDHEETADPDLQSDSANEGSASLPFTIIIALIAVAVILVVGGIIGGICFYRRLKSPANDRSQRQQPISSNNLLPGEEEVGQPSNAIPDVAFHKYEEIKPPVLTETPGYEVPRPTGMVEEDEEGYVITNISRQEESSREGEYAYAVVFQHLNPEPEYIKPERVPKKPNRRRGNLPANH